MAQKVRVSTYMKNVGKSLGYAVGDVIVKYNPVTASLIKNSKNTYSNAKSSMQRMKTNTTSAATRQFNSTSDTAFSNLIDDLKTGKWYNKDRENSLFDDYEEYDWGDDDWGDGESTPSSEESASATKSTKDMMYAMGSMSSKLTESYGMASAKSAEYIVKNNNASMRALYDLNQAGFTQVSNLLININQSIDGLITLSQPLHEHIQNSAVFFTRTTQTLDTMNDNLSTLVKRTEYLDPEYIRKNKRKNRTVGSLFAGGTIDMDSYFNLVGDNIKEIKDLYSSILSLGKMTAGKDGKNLNIMQIGLTSAIEALMPKMLKEAMTGLNESIGNLIAVTLKNGGKNASKSTNPLVRILGRIFLPDPDEKSKFNTGKYNKGPTPWDGEAKMALTQVIPEYLSQILAALGGPEGSTFDYKNGRFTTKAKVKAENDRIRNDYAARAGGRFRTDVLTSIQTNNRIKNKDQYSDEIEQFFINAFINGEGPEQIENHLNDNAWLKKYGLSKQSARILANTIKNNRKSGKAAIRNSHRNAQAAIYREQYNYGGYIENEEGNITSSLRSINNEFGSAGEMYTSQTLYLKGIYEILASQATGVNISADNIKDIKKTTNQAKNNTAGATAAKTGGATGNKVGVSNSNEVIALKQQIKATDPERYYKDRVEIKNDKEFKKWYSAYQSIKDIKEIGGSVKEKLETKVGKDGKLKSAMVKAKNIYEKPFEMVSNLIWNINDAINDIYWGDNGGIIENVKRALNERILAPIKNLFKTEVASLWGRFKDRAKNMFFGSSEGEGSGSGIGALYFSGGRSKKKKGVVSQTIKAGKNAGKAVKNQFSKTTEGLHLKETLVDGTSTLIGGITDFINQVANGHQSEEDMKKDRNAVFGTLKDILEDAGMAKGAMLVGGAAGAGVSLITGAVVGPLAGAAIGAGLGLFTQSETLQNLLFGKKPGESEEDYAKSMRKHLKDFVTDQLPNTAVAATIGGTAGAFLGSPVVGAVVGGALGFVSSSESAKKFLFGEVGEDGQRQGGAIPKELQQAVKKYMPNLTAGAIAGLLIGPFGSPIANIIFGSAMGYMSTSDKFKEFIFGEGGVADKVGDIVHNLGNAVSGGVRRLGIRLNDMITGLSAKLNDVIEKLANSDSFIGKLVGKVGTAAKGVLNAPVRLADRALGGISTGLKKYNLKKGNSVYDRRMGRNLTAKERSQLRTVAASGGVIEENGKYYRVNANGTRKEITKEKFDQLAAKNATSRGYRPNNLYSKFDTMYAQLSDEEKLALEDMDDEKLNQEINSKLGLSKGINKLQTSNLRSLMKEENAAIRDKQKAQKEREEADPNFKHITNIEKMLEHIAVRKYGYKKNGEDTNRVAQTDMFGNVHLYTQNEDGTLEEVNDDNRTSAAKQMVNKFTNAVMGIPVLGTALSKVSGFLGSIKEGLFGDGDQKKGLLGGALGAITGAVGGVFKFFTGKDLPGLGSIASKLISKDALRFMITDVVGPALLLAGFAGKFDTIASKLTNDAYNNKTSDASTEYKVTGDDGQEHTVIKNTAGQFVDITTGEVVNATKVNEANRGRASFSDKLKTNTIRNTLTGRKSVATAVLGKTKVGKGIAGLTKGMAAGGEEAMIALYSNIDDALKATAKKLSKIPALKGVDVDGMFSNLSSKIAEKLGSQSAANLAKFAANAVIIARIALAVVDFTTGYQDARTTLGITAEPSLGQKIVSGLIRVVKNLVPIVGTLIPDSLLVDLFCEYVAPALGIDVDELKKQREDAQAEVDAYNQEHGTNYSVGDYNKQVLGDYTWSEKIGNKAKAGWENVKLKASKFKESVKEKGLGGTLKEGAVGVATGIAKGAKSVGTWLKEKFDKFTAPFKTIGNTFRKSQENGFKKLKDVNGSWADFMDISDMNIDEKNPIAGFLSGIAKVGRFTAFPLAILAKVGATIKNKIDSIKQGIVNGITTSMQARQNTISAIANGEDIATALDTSEMTDSENNPLSGFMSAIAKVSAFTAIPAGLLAKTGKAIKEFFAPKFEAVKTDASGFGESLKSIFTATSTGDFVTVAEQFAWKASEENPIGKIMEIGHGFASVYGIVGGAIAGVGNAIKGFFTEKFDAISTDATTYSTSLDALKTASKDGDMSKIMGVTFEASDNNPLGGVFNIAFKIARGFNIVAGAFNKIVGPVKDLVDGFGDTVGNIGEKIGGIGKDAWDSFKEGFTSMWDSAFSGIKNWLSGGSEGANTVAEAAGSGSGFVSQYDPRYQGYNVSGTSFANKGCGPAVAAMAANALGKNISIGSAVNASKDYQTSGGVTIDYFDQVLGSQGIKTQLIAGGGAGDIYNSIARGNKVVLLGRDPYNTSKANSPFGPSNHYVLATGLDSRGNVIVNDPEARAPMHYSPAILKSASYGIAAGDSGITNNTSSAVSSSTASYSVRNDETTQTIWTFLRQNLGMSEAAAAGIMGNMQAESGCNPNRSQTKGSAYGLCQWDGGRKTKLLQIPNHDQLYVQLQYLSDELGNPSIVYWNSSGTAVDKSDGTSYKYAKMTYDEFKALTDVAAATIKFEAAFERAGTIRMANRIKYAQEFYQMFTGKTYTYDPAAISTIAYDATTNPSASANGSDTSSKPKTLLQMASSIGSIFSNAFNSIFNPTNDAANNSSDASSDYSAVSTTAGTTYDVTGASGTSKIVDYMKSKLGQLKYSMKGPRNPDKGSADCSSTVQWAVKNATGIDIGGSTPAQYNNPNLSTVWYGNGQYAETLPNGVKPGDVLFFSRPASSYTTGRADRVGHVGIYEGDGKMIHHGGSGYGPTEKNVPLGSAGKLIKISRVSNAAGANSGILSYDQMMGAGGSSKLLLSSRAGSMTNMGPVIRDPRNGRLVPINVAGGASMANASSAMLSNIANKASHSNGIPQETVVKLIETITQLLGSIANNTAPIDQIYKALVSYMQSGGASGSTAPVAVKTKEKPDPATINKDIDSNVKALVGVLADLAKG